MKAIERYIGHKKNAARLRLARSQRARMKQLDIQVAKFSDDDRRYFEQHPERNHRIRASTHCEMAQLALADANAEFPANCRWYSVIKNHAPGIRTKLYAAFPNSAATLVADEATVAKMFERLET